MIQTTRAIVIEKSVELEELISLLLCHLLDINKENSISFGTKSFALSFNSKINLLHDLNFLSIELKKNLELFAEIRNKFAHVLSVDSFTNCFDVIYKNSGSNASKNKLLDKLKIKNFDNNLEVRLSSCFDLLCIETGLLLNLSSKIIHNKKNEDLNKTSVIEIIRNFIEYEKDSSGEYLTELIKTQIKEILPNDEWNSIYEGLKNK